MKQRIDLGVCVGILGAAAWLAAMLPSSVHPPTAGEPARSVIVQSSDLATAAELVRGVDAEVTYELGIIDAVGARLRPHQLASLRRSPAIRRIYDDRGLAVSGPNVPQAVFPKLAGADALHAAAITGLGVTVAFLDTGLWHTPVGSTPGGGRRRLAVGHGRALDRRHAVHRRPDRPDRVGDGDQPLGRPGVV